jgi:hypothetical protein
MGLPEDLVNRKAREDQTLASERRAWKLASERGTRIGAP